MDKFSPNKHRLTTYTRLQPATPFFSLSDSPSFVSSCVENTLMACQVLSHGFIFDITRVATPTPFRAFSVGSRQKSRGSFGLLNAPPNKHTTQFHHHQESPTIPHLRFFIFFISSAIAACHLVLEVLPQLPSPPSPWRPSPRACRNRPRSPPR